MRAALKEDRLRLWQYRRTIRAIEYPEWIQQWIARGYVYQVGPFLYIESPVGNNEQLPGNYVARDKDYVVLNETTGDIRAYSEQVINDYFLLEKPKERG